MTDDLDLLQGVWNVCALEMDERLVPAAAISGARIKVQGTRFTSMGMGAVYEGTFELNTATIPRQLDMKFDAGPEKGNTNFCIYELNGNEWRLCVATRGSERPKGFAAPANSGIALETLRRDDGTGEGLKH